MNWGLTQMTCFMNQIRTTHHFWEKTYHQVVNHSQQSKRLLGADFPRKLHGFFGARKGTGVVIHHIVQHATRSHRCEHPEDLGQRFMARNRHDQGNNTPAPEQSCQNAFIEAERAHILKHLWPSHRDFLPKKNILRNICCNMGIAIAIMLTRSEIRRSSVAVWRANHSPSLGPMGISMGFITIQKMTSV